jgi:hypothetical protein
MEELKAVTFHNLMPNFGKGLIKKSNQALINF